MNVWTYCDIPRFFTALAQWGACIVYVFILDLRYGKRKTGLLSLLFLAVQCLLLKSTENLAIIWWIPIIVASAAMMWLMLFTLCQGTFKDIVYVTSCAFLIAETVASAEWLIHYYVAYIYGYRQWYFVVGLLVAIYGVLFYLIRMIEKRLLKRANVFFVSLRDVYLFLVTIIFMFLLSNLSYVFPDTPFSSRLFYEVFRIRALIDMMGLIVIFIFQLQIREKCEMLELHSINQVLRSQYEKYLYQQKNNELISIMYHDLKHQIIALRKEKDQKRKEEWLDSIEHGIESYRITVNTGNTVLDAILEDKLMNTRKHKITFTYVVNGKILEFMHVTDICTIFGNGLDNAIEAEVLESDPEKRMIHLKVALQRKMVCITIENYIRNPEKITLDNLQTTKQNARYHGYGIKSIRYCVEKYQGNLLIKMNQNWFVLRIMIPQKE